jgi:hypothetical protein
MRAVAEAYADDQADELPADLPDDEDLVDEVEPQRLDDLALPMEVRV